MTPVSILGRLDVGCVRLKQSKCKLSLFTTTTVMTARILNPRPTLLALIVALSLEECTLPQGRYLRNENLDPNLEAIYMDGLIT